MIMRVRHGKPGRHRHGLRLAFSAVAGLTALALFAVPGRSESEDRDEHVVLPAAPRLVLGPFPDPAAGLTDIGTPGNPPPPEAGVGALGPGSPDTGAAVAP